MKDKQIERESCLYNRKMKMRSFQFIDFVIIESENIHDKISEMH